MNMLAQGLCFAIESALNTVLPFDSSYQEKWQPMQGKTVAVKLTDWQIRLLFRYQNDAFQVFSDDEADSDVSLTGTSFEFVKVAMESRSNEAAAMQSGIHFEGQVALGQKFAKALQSLAIDWEELFAQHTGDIIAHRAFQGLKAFGKFAEDLLHNSEQNFTEYVQEEAQLAPTKIEVENFYSDLRELRQDADRLQAKIQRLLLTSGTAE